MKRRWVLTREATMIQWIGVLIALLGFAYNGVKDYQKGDIKIPQVKKVLTPIKHPVQYCLMAYDPNLDKVFYLHENGQWYDKAPQQRRYASSTQPQYYQNQESYALGDASGASGASGHRIR